MNTKPKSEIPVQLPSSFDLKGNPAMRTRTAFRYAAMIVAISFAGAGFTARASHSPNLDHAIEALKSAQKALDGNGSADPTDPMATAAPPSPQQVDEVVADLQEALKALNRATNDKGGKRDAMIAVINEAIQLVKSGDKAGADKDIAHATDEIYSAANHRGGW
jgi:hypothetical protein